MFKAYSDLHYSLPAHDTHKRVNEKNPCLMMICKQYLGNDKSISLLSNGQFLGEAPGRMYIIW